MTTKSAPGKRRPLVMGLLLATFMLGMALRLYDLDGDSLGYDETATATWSSLELRSLLADLMTRQRHDNLPLYYTVSHFFLLVLGHGELVLRLPSALFGSLSILLVYKVAEIVWGRKEGLLCGFLLTLNPYHVLYSQQARNYSLMVFLALLSLIFLLKSLQRNEKQFWAGFILSASFSLYNHYFAFLFLGAEVTFAGLVIAQNWLSYSRKDSGASPDHCSGGLATPAAQALTLLVSLCLVGVSSLPWLSVVRSTVGAQLGSDSVAVSIVRLRWSSHLLHRLLTQYSSTDGVALLVWLGLFLLGLGTTDRRHVALFGLWTAMPLAFFSFVRPAGRVFDRYLIPILPACLLVIARGTLWMARFWGRALSLVRRAPKRLAAVLALLTVVLPAFAGIVPLRTYYLSQKTDWRGAAAYLRDHMVPGDIIIADSTKPTPGGTTEVRVALSYYLGAYDLAEAPIYRVERGLWAHLMDLERPTGDVWAALWYPGTPPNTDLATTVNFHQVLIVRLREPSKDVLKDAESMLQSLLGLLPAGTARYDVHLALAEIYLRTGRVDEAARELGMASRVKPDGSSPRHLAETQRLLNPIAEAVQHPLRRSLGGVIVLLGYDVDPGPSPGGELLRTTLLWQALANMQRDYTAFIHMTGSDDQIWAQQDTLLASDNRLTSQWRVGQVVRQEYELELSPDIPPGDYLLKAGLYYWEDGQRLPVWDENGWRIPGDTILLGSINVDE
jgi:hypothetical protein